MTELTDEEKAANLYRFIMTQLTPTLRLNSLWARTVPVLRDMCKAEGITFTSQTRKADLIDMLYSHTK